MGWKVLIGVLLLATVSFAEEANQLRTIEKGTQSGIDKPLQVVVTNKTQWAELWNKHNSQRLPKPPLPEIDFSRESVVFVTTGTKNSGGYAVEISDVKRSGDNAEVLVTAKEPNPGGFAIQALTTPFHIVAVPRIKGEVKFRTETKKGG
jgi:hypothetical protein